MIWALKWRKRKNDGLKNTPKYVTNIIFYILKNN